MSLSIRYRKDYLHLGTRLGRRWSFASTFPPPPYQCRTRYRYPVNVSVGRGGCAGCNGLFFPAESFILQVQNFKPSEALLCSRTCSATPGAQYLLSSTGQQHDFSTANMVVPASHQSPRLHAIHSFPRMTVAKCQMAIRGHASSAHE